MKSAGVRVGMALGMLLGGWLSAAAEVPLDWRKSVEWALLSNPDIRQASAGYLDADGRAVGLRAILYPQAQAQVLSIPLVVYVKVEHALYDRARAPRLELAGLAREQADANFRLVLTEVVYRTRVSFLAALASGKACALREEYLQECRRALKSAGALFDAGKIKKSDVTRLQVREKLAQDQLLQAQSARGQALAELERTLGRKLDDATVAVGELGSEKVPDADVSSLVGLAFANRADLRLLKTTQAAGREKLVLSTQPLFPRVTVGGEAAIQIYSAGVGDFDLNRNDNEPGAQREAGNSQVIGNVRLAWTFYDGGRSHGQKLAAGAELAERARALVALERAIPGEVAQAVEGLERARSGLAELALAPRTADLRSMAELDWNAGKMRFLDRCLLEDTIMAQQLKVLDASYHFSLYAAALDHSLGRVADFAAP